MKEHCRTDASNAIAKFVIKKSAFQPKLLLYFGGYSHMFKVSSYISYYSLFKNLPQEKLVSYKHQ